jgi:hypothetical protein
MNFAIILSLFKKAMMFLEMTEQAASPLCPALNHLSTPNERRELL